MIKIVNSRRKGLESSKLSGLNNFISINSSLNKNSQKSQLGMMKSQSDE
jgi:hypothetical protein